MWVSRTWQSSKKNTRGISSRTSQTSKLKKTRDRNWLKKGRQLSRELTSSSVLPGSRRVKARLSWSSSNREVTNLSRKNSSTRRTSMMPLTSSTNIWSNFLIMRRRKKRSKIRRRGGNKQLGSRPRSNSRKKKSRSRRGRQRRSCCLRNLRLRPGRNGTNGRKKATFLRKTRGHFSATDSSSW